MLTLTSNNSHGEEEQKKPDTPTGGDVSNDNILNSLFEMTGIQSALQHDQIIESDAQDRVFVEREGEKAFLQIRRSK